MALAREETAESRTRWGVGTVGGDTGGKTPITIPLKLCEQR